VTKDRNNRNAEPEQASSSEDKPTKVTGPIYGVPAHEVLAWVKSWTTEDRIPKPKVRRVR
jgi:hypothetical protein